MRVGLFGGTFDPFHLGHRKVAEAALESAGLEHLVVLPACVSPHKQEAPPAGPDARWLMCVLGTLDDPRMTVERWDLDREGASYTYDTVTRARAVFGPEAELHWILGADHVPGLMGWHRAPELLAACRFLVVPREGRAGAELAAAIREHLPETLAERVTPLPMPLVPISATDIRSRVARQAPLDGLVPELTAVYLRRYNLYAQPANQPPAGR